MKHRPIRSAISCIALASLFACSIAVRAAEPASLAATYKTRADQLIGAAMVDDEGYANLAWLTDHIGKRVSGSEPLDRAIAWAADLMRRQGLANVTLQPVMIPRWVRGAESAAIVGPVTKPLHMLGLGMSVGTPAGGLTAEVVVSASIDEMTKAGRGAVAGKIVVLNVPYEGYGRTVRARVLGPSIAASLGAVGLLVRSITPLAMQTPHTGTLVYDEKQPKIPAAAISPEDASMLARLVAEGQPVKVHLDMQARREADVKSANVIGEIVGSMHPEEVVVLGGHIDSWDVGQGAQDDGSGIMATLQAVNLIKKAGLKPQRTIRVVFWVNEMDGGAEQPVGYGYGSGAGVRRAGGEPQVPPEEQHSFDLLRDIATLLKPVGADTIKPGGFGSDIEPLTDDGVPALGEMTTMAHYFDWHHTEADTLDKVDPVDFRKNIASLAVMAYVLADMPEKLVGHKKAKTE